MGTKVYMAWHCYEYQDKEYEEKFLGICSTPAKAESAIAFLRDKPGFRDYPDGFDIRDVTLDRIGWVEGFRRNSTVRRGIVPALGWTLSTGLPHHAKHWDVYGLWHCYEDENGQDQERTIGIYSTRENAEHALAFVRDKPGFRDHPDGFKIRPATLDCMMWEEGFAIIPPDEE